VRNLESGAKERGMGYRGSALKLFFEKVVLLIHGAKRRIGRFLLTMGLMGLSFTVTME
jgi:hypothetical protein